MQNNPVVFVMWTGFLWFGSQAVLVAAEEKGICKESQVVDDRVDLSTPRMAAVSLYLALNRPEHKGLEAILDDQAVDTGSRDEAVSLFRELVDARVSVEEAVADRFGGIGLAVLDELFAPPRYPRKGPFPRPPFSYILQGDEEITGDRAKFKAQATTLIEMNKRMGTWRVGRIFLDPGILRWIGIDSEVMAAAERKLRANDGMDLWTFSRMCIKMRADYVYRGIGPDGEQKWEIREFGTSPSVHPN